MNRISFFFFLFFLPSILLAQDNNLAQEYYDEADSLRAVGLYAESFKKATQAQTIWKQQENWENYIQSACLQAIAKLNQGDGPGTKSLLLEKQDVVEGKLPPDSYFRGRYYYWLSYGYMYSNELDSALQMMKIAEKVLVKHESKRGELGSCYSVMGIIYLRLGDAYEALDCMGKAVVLQEDEKDAQTNLANTYANMGIQYAASNQPLKGREYLEKSLKIKEPYLGQPNMQLSLIYASLSSVYSALNDDSKAILFGEKALITKKKYPLDTPQHSIAYLMSIKGGRLHDSGDYEEAIKFCNNALKEHNHSVELYDIYRIRGKVYIDTQKYEEAIIDFKKCLKLVSENSLEGEYYSSGINIEIGIAYEEINEFDSALNYLQKVKKYAEQLEDVSERRIETYTRLGILYSKNNFDSALYYFDKSASNNILDFSNITLENILYPGQLLISEKEKMALLNRLPSKKYHQMRSETHNLLSKILEAVQGNEVSEREKIRMAYWLLDANTEQIKYLSDIADTEKDIFKVLEQQNSSTLKSKILADYHAEFHVPTSALDLLRDTKAKRDYYQNQLYDETDKRDGSRKDKIIALEEKSNALSFRLDSLNTLIKTQYPNYHKLKYSTATISLERTQSSLEANQALIEYFVGDSSIYAFTITNDLAEIQQLEIQPSQLSKLVKTFRQSLNKPDADWKNYLKSGHELYQAVLQASIQKLPKGIKHLIIVPDGELGYVPFESLLTQKAEGENYAAMPYLVRGYQISYAYSATLLFDGFQHERNPSNDGVLSFAPAYQNSKTDSIQLLALGKFRDQITSLVWNQKEANQITQSVAGKPFLGEFATERAFKQNAGDYNILHLAMHALVDDQNPMYSKLVFTQSEDSTEDNYLNAYELYNMKLNANLAVLSACNTGYGKLVRGEGIMSLARGFAYAGCPSVVMSHWQVDDEATSKLMEYFYEGLSEGMTKSEALRNAQLKYLDTAEPRQAHPFYWSSFVMIGEDTPIKSSSNFIYWIGLLFLGLGIALMMKMRGKK